MLAQADVSGMLESSREACWQDESARLGLLGLTVPTLGGSFQRCLIDRCGKAERQSLELYGVWSRKESVLGG